MSGRLASSYTEPHPRCFMHLPKCGGVSVHEALLAAMPEASVSPKRYDHLLTGFVGVDELGPELRETLLLDEQQLDDMARSELVSGHFPLPTLLRIAPPGSIATVLREPRARLLSLYAFWRLTPEWDETSGRDRLFEHALRPLDEFLAEPLIKRATDNVMCRTLLAGDPRIQMHDFISPEDMDNIASDAIDRLDQLGFVGVLELGRKTWEGLSRFFGVSLEATRLNVTASDEVASDSLPMQEPISNRTLGLIQARTVADTIVYRHALMADSTEAEARLISDAAFAAQLFRFGDIAGRSAASVPLLTRRVAEAESQVDSLREQLKRREEDLARHRMWLDGIQGSISWRITSPLRAVKRRVLSARPR